MTTSSSSSKAGTVGGAAPQPTPECCMCGDYGLSYELFQCKVCQYRSQHRLDHSFIHSFFFYLSFLGFPLRENEMNGLWINPPNLIFDCVFLLVCFFSEPSNWTDIAAIFIQRRIPTESAIGALIRRKTRKKKLRTHPIPHHRTETTKRVTLNSRKRRAAATVT